MLKQISLFAANTKGALGKIIISLATAPINIYTMLMKPLYLRIYWCCTYTTCYKYDILLL